MKVLATVKLELVRQEGQWEACEGCPATHDPFTKGSLCRYLSNLATKAMGEGFASCGGGATWRVAPELTAQQTALVEEVTNGLAQHERDVTSPLGARPKRREGTWTHLYIPEGLGK